MLTDPSIEKLKTKTTSSYDLVMLVSERARQLVDGAQPLVPADDAPNAVSLACREIVADKVVGVEGNVKCDVPITREERKRRQMIEEERRRKNEEDREVAIFDQEADGGLDSLLATVSRQQAEDAEQEAEAEDIDEDIADEEEFEEDEE
ncbi:MAG: DNA-directed RNA polymerase subunit omega [Clostridiales bacterium]|nr:DNA-directed RNA polymerase subunit omega [Clostridiales bacterium]